MKKKSIWAVIFATVATAGALVATNNYSIQEALNALSQGTVDTDLHRYSTQEAANLLVQEMNTRTERDSLVGMVCIVYDDCMNVQWDSVRCLNPTRGGPGTADGRTWDFPAGISMDAHQVLYGDTTNTTMSPAKIRGLLRRGWDMGAVGYYEGYRFIAGNATLWNSDRGAIAAGNFTSTDPFEFMLSQARNQATLDSIGIPYKPRWLCYSNSGGTAFQASMLSRLGYEFGYVSGQSASGVGIRPSSSYPIFSFAGGDTGMVSNTLAMVAMTPGLQPSRYEIVTNVTDGNTSINTKRAIWRAMQTKGLCVINIHSPIVWAASMAAAGDTLGAYGGLRSLSGVMSFCNRYVKAGLLRVVTPSEAADWFYNRPISPGANWVNSNFRDIDRSVHSSPTTMYRQDNWMQVTSNWGVPTKALLGNPTAGGYGGKNYCTMRWATGVKATLASRTTARSFNQYNTAMWVVPPKGGDWTAHFEIFAIEDTVASVATAVGDTVGITFTVAKVGYWNNYAGVTPQLYPLNAWGSYTPDLYVPGGTPTGEVSSSIRFAPATAQTTIVGNYFVMAAANNVLAGVAGPRHKEWLHMVADWEYPAGADIMFVSVWHGTTAASGKIRLSNPHLSFFKNSPPAGN